MTATGLRRRCAALVGVFALVGAVSVVWAGSAVATPGPVYGSFTFGGSGGGFGGTLTMAPGFPAAAYTSTSRAGGVGVQTGATTWLPVGSPPGAVFGSSQGVGYLNLRPAADNVTGASVTTYTFAGPTPAAGWGFVLGDIDADQLTITATAPDGSAVPTSGLGFAGVFNYCDASPRSATCSGQNAPFDLPAWDPATATLRGNAAAADTTGASGWFQPTVSLQTLTFTYQARAGLPVYQTWFATQTRAVSGGVSADGDALAGVTVEIVDAAGTVVGTAQTSADGSYAVDGLAPGAYTVRAITPAGYSPIGPTQRFADLTNGEASGLDFAFTAPSDLSIIKSVDTTPVVAGQTVHYTLTASNAGPGSATGVTVTDTVPPDLTGATGQVTGGAACSASGVTLICVVGTLANGASATIAVTGQVPATATPGATLTNSAAIAGDQPDPSAGNNRATVASTVTASADLSMTKTFTPAAPVAGQPVTYHLTIDNAGPSRATGPVITDPLDPAVGFVSADIDTGTCIQADHIVTCHVPTLDPGGSVTATVTVTLPTDSAVAVQNAASVSATTPDPNTDNNTSSVAFQASAAASLALTKTVTPSTAAAGQDVSYLLTVSNNGPSDAPNAVLTDPIPAWLTDVTVTDPDGGTCTVADAVTCRWATMPAQQNREVTLTATVDPAAPDGPLTNTATVTSPVSDPDATDNAASATLNVRSSADVSLTKTVTPTPAVPGLPVTYTLVAANAGPQRAGAIQLNDPMPDGLTDITVDDPADCAIDGSVVDCLFDGIDAGASRTITITANLPAAYPQPDLTNTATLTSLLTGDPNPTNNTATAQDPVAASADLAVTKRVTPAATTPGGQITYTLLVTNAGPSTARAVRLTDPIPTPVLTPSPSTTTGTCATTGQLIDCRLGDLAPNESATVTVTAAVAADADGPITNTVTVSSDTTDPDPDNNTASASFTAAPTTTVSTSSTTTTTSSTSTTVTDTTTTTSPATTGTSTTPGPSTTTTPRSTSAPPMTTNKSPSTHPTTPKTTTATTTAPMSSQPTTPTSAGEPPSLADTGSPIAQQLIGTITLLSIGTALTIGGHRKRSD